MRAPAHFTASDRRWLAGESRPQIAAAINAAGSPAPEARAWPVMTWALVASITALFALQAWWSSSLWDWTITARMGAPTWSRVTSGELWRLVASNWLHANVFHLALNVWGLIALGRRVERALGSGPMLGLYLVSGLLGSLASLLRPGEAVGIGASGAWWGLMTAEAMLLWRPGPVKSSDESVLERQRSGRLVISNALFSLLPGIDLLGHFGGGVGGVLCIEWLQRSAKRGALEGARRKLTGVAMVLGVVSVASMSVSLFTGKAWLRDVRWELVPTTAESLQFELSVPRGFEPSQDPEGRPIWGDLWIDGAQFMFWEDNSPATLDPDEAVNTLRAGLDELQGLKWKTRPYFTSLPDGRRIVLGVLEPDPAAGEYSAFYVLMPLGPRVAGSLVWLREPRPEGRLDHMLSVLGSVKTK